MTEKGKAKLRAEKAVRNKIKQIVYAGDENSPFRNPSLTSSRVEIGRDLEKLFLCNGKFRYTTIEEFQDAWEKYAMNPIYNFMFKFVSEYFYYEDEGKVMRYTYEPEPVPKEHYEGNNEHKPILIPSSFHKYWEDLKRERDDRIVEGERALIEEYNLETY